ncbi:MAG: protein-disulfide reductase DsbD family protein [Paracoccus sp. (in: a-proteobacteria)]|nr:protein-disulfide reductase DsbD family protein [Paracoccus sp. (in: a-proteobacteria)]
MRRFAPAFAAFLYALPAWAELPPGLESARLLPGWVEGGKRISALELVLSPGWKTYWRSPGDAGIPPSFDWEGDAAVEVHWPQPALIDSAGMVTLGYEDRVIVPLTASGDGPLAAKIELGLCEAVCVPADLSLVAPPPGDAPDPAILAAMETVSQVSAVQPACTITEISDGMQVAVTLPQPARAAAIELPGTEIWVSQPDLADGVALSDLVPPQAAPFDLDPAQIVLTVIGTDGAAMEYRGCHES